MDGNSANKSDNIVCNKTDMVKSEHWILRNPMNLLLKQKIINKVNILVKFQLLEENIIIIFYVHNHLI